MIFIFTLFLLQKEHIQLSLRGIFSYLPVSVLIDDYKNDAITESVAEIFRRRSTSNNLNIATRHKASEEELAGCLEVCKFRACSTHAVDF